MLVSCSNYNIIETLDDHTSLITTVKFACCGSKLLSCSADKCEIDRPYSELHLSSFPDVNSFKSVLCVVRGNLLVNFEVIVLPV